MSEAKAKMEREVRAVFHDVDLELLPIGKIVHLTTATFGYRGRLMAVTPSYYVLDDAVWVFSIGRVEDYMRTMTAREEEATGSRILVERAANVSISSWND